MKIPQRKNRQKKTNALRPQRGSTQKKRQRNFIPKKSSLSTFSKALKDPFDPKVLGCQVPDPFPFPTATYHSHTTSVIGVNPLSIATHGAVLLLPNPLISMIDLSFINNSASTSSAFVRSTPMARIGTSSTLAGYGCYGATTPTDLNSKYSEYRVVSWGIKISSLMPEMVATGRIIIAFLPCGDTVPNWQQLKDMQLPGGLNGIVGVPYQAMLTSQLLNLPTAFELTAGDFLRGDIQLSGMYTNTEFWTFKTTGNTVTPYGGSTMGDSVNVNSSGVAAALGYKDQTRCVGGAGIVIYCEGLPDGMANAFQIECIYHLEGSPQLNTVDSAAIVPSSMPTGYAGTTQQVEQGLASVSTVEAAVKFITRGANFLNNNQDTIISSARTLRNVFSQLMI